MALIEEVAERGYAAVTSADVAARAGISMTAFRRCYLDLEDCALRVLEDFIADYKWRIGTAYNRHSEWRDALRAAAYAAADWMIELPSLVRFGTVEVLEMKSEMARVRREEVFLYCTAMIDGGRAVAPDPAAVPPSAAVVAIGSITQLLTHRVQKGEAIRPRETVPEMMYAAVRPYLGEAVAREELTIPAPPTPPEGSLPA